MHLLTWTVLDPHGDKLKIRLQRDVNTAEYAILSHRWCGDANDEVSYGDMVAGRPEEKKGYEKLVGCCKQAWREGLQYVWADTCCFDKSSSAELSETITSMYSYYEQSKVCYVYLHDVSIDHTANEEILSSSFSNSDWFTRGWTLQELIAPKRVKFFNRSWAFIGYKTDTSLSHIIQNITNIDKVILSHPNVTKQVSVAQKMSWASRRETSRVEDRAYSLMGIFSVYMPPMYGEGIHAFIRLQEAILRISNDHSIFAWTSLPKNALSEKLEHVSTMLALSPDQFEFSSGFKPFPQNNKHVENAPHSSNKFDYALTNVGLAIRLPLLKIEEVEGLYAAFLSCGEGEYQLSSAILLRTSLQTPRNHFWRTISNEGPIERSSRLWFPVNGRDDIAEEDIYILPRFTTVSADNIEPKWSRETILQMAWRITMSETNKSRLTLNSSILSSLHHVPDPSFDQLASLQQIQHLIMANQPEQLFEKISTKRNSIVLLPLRNPNFHGRVAALQQLRDVLSPSDTSVGLDVRKKSIQSCILSGIGGIGKTQLALEFCYSSYENRLFNGIFWIHAETSKTISASFRTIATNLNLTQKEASDENVTQEVFHWLYNTFELPQTSGSNKAKPRQWLLVFDNLETTSLLRRVWPSRGHGSVLIITRDPGLLWVDEFGSESITLEPFSDSEASEYIRKLTGIDEDSTAMIKHLDGSPLAVTQMAGLIVRLGISFTELTSMFDMSGESSSNENKSIPDHRSSLSSTLFSHEINALSATSLALLQVITFLDPDSISDSILVPSRTAFATSYPQTLSDLIDGREDLMKRSLISRTLELGNIRIHRSIQSNVMVHMDPGDFQRAIATAISLVYSAWLTRCFREEGEEMEIMSYMSLLPHIRRLKEFETRFKDPKDDGITRTKFNKLLGSLH